MSDFLVRETTDLVHSDEDDDVSVDFSDTDSHSGQTTLDERSEGGGKAKGRRCKSMSVSRRKTLLQREDLSEEELQELRMKINHRERTRMHDLNSALEGLREVMPYANGPSVRRLSKIATLLLAKNYIQMLQNSLDELKKLVSDVFGSRNTHGQVPAALHAYGRVPPPTLHGAPSLPTVPTSSILNLPMLSLPITTTSASPPKTVAESPSPHHIHPAHHHPRGSMLTSPTPRKMACACPQCTVSGMSLHSHALTMSSPSLPAWPHHPSAYLTGIPVSQAHS